MQRSFFTCSFALFVTSMNVGCASIITGAGETQSVRFASEPRGAKVYVDENYVGVTPVSSNLTRKDDHYVRMELAGETKTQQLKSGFNPWFLGNILLGGIIGGIVDLCDGAYVWTGAGSVTEKFNPPSWYNEPTTSK